jgi:hypothetical protein
VTARASMQVGQFGRPTLSKDGRTITVHIPMTLRHQGGRKQVVTPAGATPWVPPRTRIDSTLVKAIVRAHRWRDMLESGDYATVRDSPKRKPSTSPTWANAQSRLRRKKVDLLRNRRGVIYQSRRVARW